MNISDKIKFYTEYSSILIQIDESRKRFRKIDCTWSCEEVETCFLDWQRSQKRADDSKALMRGWKDYRSISEFCDNLLSLGRKYCQIGGNYSGETTYEVSWGSLAAATLTNNGSYYKSGYARTNARHILELDCEWAVELYNNKELVFDLRLWGLDIIGLKKSATADDIDIYLFAAVKRYKNKQIALHYGWVGKKGEEFVHGKGIKSILKEFKKKSLISPKSEL